MAPIQLRTRQRACADLVLLLLTTRLRLTVWSPCPSPHSHVGVLHFYQTCTRPMAGQNGSREVHVLTESHGLVPDSRCI
jgi:hypothetical protein